MKHSVWLYPWDLVQLGPDTVADTLKRNELQAVDLTLNYHGARALSWGNHEQVVHHVADGACYFNPQADLYGRLRPQPAPWLLGEEPVLEAADHLVAQGIEIRAWTVFGFNRALGLAHPDLIGRNAIGDPNPDALCPAHPEVRAYFAAMAEDLAANTPVAGISMEAVEYLPFGYHALVDKSGWHIDPVVQWLLGMCFCDACCARIPDAEAKRQLAADWIHDYLQDLLSPNPMEVEDAFRDICTERQKIVAEVVHEVAAAAERHGKWCELLLGGSPASCAWYGIDTARVVDVCHEFTVLAYAAEPDHVASQVAAWLRYTDAPVRCGLAAVSARSEDELIERARAAAAAGAHSLVFYNYGIVPPKVRDWIGPAIRAFRSHAG